MTQDAPRPFRPNAMPREGLSLRLRLNLMIAAAMLLILGLGFLFAIHDARRSVAEEARSTVHLALQLIEAGQASAGHDAAAPDAGWLAQLGHLERTRHLRIHIAGKAASPPDAAAAERADGAPGWFRWAVAPEPIVEERLLTDGAGGTFAIRIEADSGDETAEAWRETQGFLWLLLALALAVYGLVHITVGRAFRAVGQILGGLEGIEKGEYGRRLPDFALPEFQRIADAFNHMAAALEKSRQENRALVRQSMAIQEEERRHLASELHDEFGQSVTAIKVMAAALRHHGDETHREAAIHIITSCDRLFGVVRGMMRRLRPSLLDELGLAASLEDLVQDWRASHPGLSVECACASKVDACAGDANIHLYRIVQECLTNVARHAKAHRVHILVSLAEAEGRHWIVLSVKDDGHGFDPWQPRRGFGLAVIKERAAGLGGRFKLDTGPGQGTAIEVRIPYGEPIR
jgi:two-component system sensor histidine kinase UhpB